MHLEIWKRYRQLQDASLLQGVRNVAAKQSQPRFSRIAATTVLSELSEIRRPNIDPQIVEVLILGAPHKSHLKYIANLWKQPYPSCDVAARSP